jgi:hypothetical protein
MNKSIETLHSKQLRLQCNQKCYKPTKPITKNKQKEYPKIIDEITKP